MGRGDVAFRERGRRGSEGVVPCKHVPGDVASWGLMPIPQRRTVTCSLSLSSEENRAVDADGKIYGGIEVISELQRPSWCLHVQGERNMLGQTYCCEQRQEGRGEEERLGCGEPTEVSTCFILFSWCSC